MTRVRACGPALANRPGVSAKSTTRRSAAEAWPDGLSAGEHGASRGWRRHASAIGLGILSLAMVFALSGLAGMEETRTAESAAARVTWHAPARIRNGEFFEIRLNVEAREAIDELVVGVEVGLWEDFTINTFIPAATEETSEDGELLFTFGPVGAGSSFLLKVDGQINPDMLWRNEGVVTVYDGEEALTEMPIAIEVLP